MKKLRLNKEIISRLDNPQRIYGGGNKGSLPNNDCAKTLNSFCNAACADTDQDSCICPETKDDCITKEGCISKEDDCVTNASICVCHATMSCMICVITTGA
jgi:hypothetical protein